MPSGALPPTLVAAIALWVVVRYPSLAPRSAFGVSSWLVAAVALTISARTTFTLLGPIAALVVVEVTSGVCMMLAVAWTTMWVIRAASTSR